MKYNKKTFIVFAIILTSLEFGGCSVSSSMYLQSFSGYTEDETYGKSVSNPIILKYSKKYNYESVIEEYISRLYLSNIIPANYTIKDNSIEYQPESIIRGSRDISIVQKQIVSIENNDAKNETSNSKNEIFNTIFIYDLISEEAQEKIRLYFKLSKNNKKFYVPQGLMYSIMCG